MIGVVSPILTLELPHHPLGFADGAPHRSIAREHLAVLAQQNNRWDRGPIRWPSEKIVAVPALHTAAAVHVVPRSIPSRYVMGHPPSVAHSS